MSEVKLLPCPFCGHAPQDWPDFLHPTGSGWRDDPIGDGTTFRHYMRADDPRGVHGRCWELGCLTHEGGCGAIVVGDSRDEAIAAWNRRATATKDANMEPLLRERDALRNRLEDTVRDLTDAKAENERLRGEVAEAKDGWHMANSTAELAMKHRDEAEARAERLAEALRLALKWAEVLPTGEPLRAESVRDLDEARAALDQEGGNG